MAGIFHGPLHAGLSMFDDLRFYARFQQSCRQFPPACSTGAEAMIPWKAPSQDAPHGYGVSWLLETIGWPCSVNGQTAPRILTSQVCLLAAYPKV